MDNGHAHCGSKDISARMAPENKRFYLKPNRGFKLSSIIYLEI